MGALPQLIEEDIAHIDGALDDLLRATDASVMLLIDKGGFVITQRGAVRDLDTTTLAALAAGSFGATQSLAAIVQEPNFNCLYQQGDQTSLLLHNVDEHTIAVVLFGPQAGVGAIRHYLKVTVERVAGRIALAQRRAPHARLDLSMLNIADTRLLFRKAGA
jgi:predicted regulator of Ras-like GTPase activity (Roadblock/LC7/MglB family)